MVFFYNSHLKKRNRNGILMQTHWGKNTNRLILRRFFKAFDLYFALSIFFLYRKFNPHYNVKLSPLIIRESNTLIHTMTVIILLCIIVECFRHSYGVYKWNVKKRIKLISIYGQPLLSIESHFCIGRAIWKTHTHNINENYIWI